MNIHTSTYRLQERITIVYAWMHFSRIGGSEARAHCMVESLHTKKKESLTGFNASLTAVSSFHFFC